MFICNIFRVYELDVLAPSDFKTNPSWFNTNYKELLVALIPNNSIVPFIALLLVSSEVTCFVCRLLFVLVVEEWVREYGISVTILRVAITST
ncbi:hypothetical protein J1605_017624, partial [Eschrichtius robustus]